MAKQNLILTKTNNINDYKKLWAGWCSQYRHGRKCLRTFDKEQFSSIKWGKGWADVTVPRRLMVECGQCDGENPLEVTYVVRCRQFGNIS